MGLAALRTGLNMSVCSGKPVCDRIASDGMAVGGEGGWRHVLCAECAVCVVRERDCCTGADTQTMRRESGKW